MTLATSSVTISAASPESADGGSARARKAVVSQRAQKTVSWRCGRRYSARACGWIRAAIVDPPKEQLIAVRAAGRRPVTGAPFVYPVRATRTRNSGGALVHGRTPSSVRPGDHPPVSPRTCPGPTIHRALSPCTRCPGVLTRFGSCFYAMCHVVPLNASRIGAGLPGNACAGPARSVRAMMSGETAFPRVPLFGDCPISTTSPASCHHPAPLQHRTERPITSSGAGTKIRTIRGPTLPERPWHVPTQQVSTTMSPVPPADEETAGRFAVPHPALPGHAAYSPKVSVRTDCPRPRPSRPVLSGENPGSMEAAGERLGRIGCVTRHDAERRRRIVLRRSEARRATYPQVSPVW